MLWRVRRRKLLTTRIRLPQIEDRPACTSTETSRACYSPPPARRHPLRAPREPESHVTRSMRTCGSSHRICSKDAHLQPVAARSPSSSSLRSSSRTGSRSFRAGGYFQTVPIDVVKADPATIKVTASGKATANLRFTDDVVVWPGSATASSAARGELVFVGYGAKAPEYSWDDFKGMDLKGKILLVLVNDPPAPASEPTLFGGKAMTYYGRWTYKYEEAERQGAAGMLIIHTPYEAGYGWQVVVGSNSVEHRLLPRPSPTHRRRSVCAAGSSTMPRLRCSSRRGSISPQLTKEADTREFKPVATGITIDMSSTNSVAHMSARNVDRHRAAAATRSCANSTCSTARTTTISASAPPSTATRSTTARTTTAPVSRRCSRSRTRRSGA